MKDPPCPELASAAAAKANKVRRLLVRIGALFAAVVLVPWLLWVVFRPAEARNARAAVSWANDDLIWQRVPRGFEFQGSYVHYADADWVPQFPTRDAPPSSSVGKRYSPRLAAVDDVNGWVRAAESAGWVYVGCSRSAIASGDVPQFIFTRDESGQEAELRIRNDNASDALLVTIAISSDPDFDAPRTTTDGCIADDPTTWLIPDQPSSNPAAPEPFTPEDPAAP